LRFCFVLFGFNEKLKEQVANNINENANIVLDDANEK
jgi:hypothetical protein